MKFNNYLKTKIPFFMALISLVGLSSCGSYQYVGQDNDGIYESSDKPVEHKQEVTSTENNNDYYKNYFKQKSNELGSVAEEEEIFTDIDSYEGNYTEEPVVQNQIESRPGWGQESSNVSINIFPNTGFGYYNSWDRWGWGWNNPWRWNRGFAFNYGFGGFYDPFWCPSPFYGGGFYGYAYNGYYGHPYYSRNWRSNYYGRGLAYTNTRRNSIARRGVVNRTRANRARTNSTRNSIRTRPSTRPNNSIRTRPSTRPNNSIRTRPSTRPNNSIRTRPSSGTRSISRPSRGGRSYSSGRSGGRSGSSGRSRGRL